jgi:hypothetical protein
MNPTPPPVDNPVKRESSRQPPNSLRKLNAAANGRRHRAGNPSADALSLIAAARSHATAPRKTLRHRLPGVGSKNFPQRNFTWQGKTR